MLFCMNDTHFYGKNELNTLWIIFFHAKVKMIELYDIFDFLSLLFQLVIALAHKTSKPDDASKSFEVI